MTQVQAVRETLRKLGGVATLKDIYKHIHEIGDCKWNTKTPNATIRRIVQEDKEIIRLKAGHYMLTEFRDKMVMEQIKEQTTITHVEMHFHGPVGQAIAHVDTLNTEKTK